MINKQDGFALLPFSLFMAVAMALMFMFASGKSEQLIRRYSVAQSTSYAQELSARFAQRLRWSYDIARADAMPTAPGLCGTYGGAIQNVGAIPLCLVDGRICINHPRSNNLDVCIATGDSPPSLIARFDERRMEQDWLWAIGSLAVPQARAALGEPPLPPAGEVLNQLNVPPTCIDGPCGAVCGGNADCLTFRFCPLIGSCTKPEEYVWQTIAFLK